MSDLETKRSTENALKAFATQPLKVVTTGLFNALGYASKKTLDLKPNGMTRACAPSFRRRRSHAISAQ